MFEWQCIYIKKWMHTIDKQSNELLTSSSSRTASIFPQRAASCNAVPDFVCRFISIPAWISNLNTYTQENFIKHVLFYLNTLKDIFPNTILNSTKFINLYIKRLVLILINTSFQKKKLIKVKTCRGPNTWNESNYQFAAYLHSYSYWSINNLICALSDEITN